MKWCGKIITIVVTAIVSSIALTTPTSFAQSSSAQGAPAPDATKDSARFMLAPSHPVSDSGIEKVEKTANDFAWASLTHNGPASGAAPVIGEKSGKAFFEFADGRPHPFYIQPPTK